MLPRFQLLFSVFIYLWIHCLVSYCYFIFFNLLGYVINMIYFSCPVYSLNLWNYCFFDLNTLTQSNCISYNFWRQLVKQNEFRSNFFLHVFLKFRCSEVFSNASRKLVSCKEHLMGNPFGRFDEVGLQESRSINETDQIVRFSFSFFNKRHSGRHLSSSNSWKGSEKLNYHLTHSKSSLIKVMTIFFFFFVTSSEYLLIKIRYRCSVAYLKK